MVGSWQGFPSEASFDPGHSGRDSAQGRCHPVSASHIPIAIKNGGLKVKTIGKYGKILEAHDFLESVVFPAFYFKWLRHALHHTSMIFNIGLAMWDGENLISYWTWFQIIPHPDWTTMFAQPSPTSSAAAGDVATLPGFGQQRVVLCTFGSEWWSTFRPAGGGHHCHGWKMPEVNVDFKWCIKCI